MCLITPRVNERIIISLSLAFMPVGSNRMPLLPPPKGTPIKEVFHVISIDKPCTSSIVTEPAILMPPFAGPSESLCLTTNALTCICLPSLNVGLNVNSIFSFGSRSLLSIWSEIFSRAAVCSRFNFAVCSIPHTFFSAAIILPFIILKPLISHLNAGQELFGLVLYHYFL